MIEVIKKRIAEGIITPASFEVLMRRKITAIAIDESLGVLYDHEYKLILGLLDAEDVDMANSFRCGFVQSRIISINDNLKTITSLSVLVMCRAHGFFSSKDFHVHHKYNEVDNRRDSLELRKPYSIHRAECPNIEKHINKVLAEHGFTYESAIECICKKVEEMKRQYLTKIK